MLPAALAGAVLMAGALPAAVARAEGETVTHVVMPGENLFRIALRYGVPLRELLAANGIGNPDYVRAGTVLVIPGARAGMALPAPAADAGQPPPVQQAEPSPPVTLTAAAADTAGTAGGGRLHRVAPGENLFRIALRYGVAVAALARANSLPNPDMLVAGQTLVIPDGSGAGGGAREASVAPGEAPAPFQPLIATPNGFTVFPQAENLEGVDFSAAPWFRLTHYCLTGAMASGRQVYLGAVAADQSVFPLGTRLLIEGYGFFTVEDRFAWDARQARLDVWVPSCWEAVQRGVQYRRVFIVAPR